MNDNDIALNIESGYWYEVAYALLKRINELEERVEELETFNTSLTRTARGHDGRRG